MLPTCFALLYTKRSHLRGQTRPHTLMLLACAALWLTAGCGSSASTPSSAGNGNSTTGGTSTGPTGGTIDPGTTIAKDYMAVTGLHALPLSGCVFSVYSGTFNIGSNNFQLLVDSGSSTTAVAGSACTTCSELTPVYPTANQTSVGASVDAEYGDQSGWSGPVYQDVMGATANGNMVTPQVAVKFAAMDTEKDFFTESTCPGANDANNAYQGILGLGPDVLLLDKTTSYLAAIKAAGTFKNDAFAVHLCDNGGEMWFGGYEPTVASGSAMYTPMVQQSRTDVESNYYGVTFSALAVNGKNLGLSAQALGTSVVDTGTSAFLVSSTAFQKLVTAISSDANYKANFTIKLIYGQSCEESDRSPAELDSLLPTLGVTMPGETANSSFTLTLKASESYLFGFKYPDGRYYYCSSITASNQNIMGAAMMRNHVVVFDRDNDRVGFVPQNSCSAELPPFPVDFGR